jgi:hypothetical protein
MVNTFLVISPTNKDGYKESARCLDRQRLGKQRVEAYQILCLIEDLMYLAKKYKKPLPGESSKWKKWVRSLARIYKKKGYKFIAIEGEYYKVEKGWKREWLEEDERLVNLGFVYHPVVLMWIKYPEALKVYINSHIEVWVERGYKNNMKLYDVDFGLVEHPPWVYDKEFLQNHRGALIQKEIDRNEPKHYQKMDIFLDAPTWKSYVWLLENKTMKV